MERRNTTTNWEERMKGELELFGHKKKKKDGMGRDGGWTIFSLEWPRAIGGGKDGWV